MTEIRVNGKIIKNVELVIFDKDGTPLAGYDGYPDESDPKYKEMVAYWEKVRKCATFHSLTPTTYPLKIKSIYQEIH